MDSSPQANWCMFYVFVPTTTYKKQKWIKKSSSGLLIYKNSLPYTEDREQGESYSNPFELEEPTIISICLFVWISWLKLEGSRDAVLVWKWSTQLLCVLYSVGNLSPAKGARNQVGIGLSYWPASLCSLAIQFQTRFLELISHHIAGLKFSALDSIRVYYIKPATPWGDMITSNLFSFLASHKTLDCCFEFVSKLEELCTTFVLLSIAGSRRSPYSLLPGITVWWLPVKLITWSPCLGGTGSQCLTFWNENISESSGSTPGSPF